MNPPNPNEPHPLAPVMERARRDPFFLGCVLNEHARRNGWDDEALAAHLQCPLDRLPHVFLCRCPEDRDPQFLQQVRRIAEYVPCDETQLLLVLREVVAWRRLSGPAGTKANSFFLAARDRLDTKNRPAEDDQTEGNEAP